MPSSSKERSPHKVRGFNCKLKDAVGYADRFFTEDRDVDVDTRFCEDSAKLLGQWRQLFETDVQDVQRLENEFSPAIGVMT